MEIKAEHLYKSYNKLTILNDVSFVLEKGQKAGLVGSNGIGKSTLLKILAGKIKSDAGTITTRKGLSVYYVPQDISLVTSETISDYLYRVSGMRSLKAQITTSPKALAEYKQRQGYSFDHRMVLILTGFGFNQSYVKHSIMTLSSGQKNKVFLIGVLLSDPDLLLLDEPTNNLDIPALIWLEDFLKKSRSAAIVVSHDRLFLDHVVNKIFAIDWQTRTFRIMDGKYSDYLAQVEGERERHNKVYEQQKEEIKRLTKVVRDKKIEAMKGSHFRGKDNDKFLRGFKRDRAAKSGNTAKSIEKRLEQIERVEKPVERNAFRIYIRPPKTGGSRNIILDKVIAGYADNGFRISSISMTISYGNRIVILGLNGAGKSTLLKTISGKLKPLRGEVKISRGLVMGNLMQEHDNLPSQESLKNFLVRRGGMTTHEAYALFVKFGFQANEIDKKIEDLSPGARSRLLFALFSALSVNVLVLDEPTNHLDLGALNALEEAITYYQGTILLVSHDRYFLQSFKPTDVYVLSDGELIRQKDIESYLQAVTLKAHRLIKMMSQAKDLNSA